MSFPHLLRSWRQKRRLSQLGLALESGVSQRHVSFLESGRAHPSRAMLLQLADGLRLSLFTVIATFGTAQDVPADDATERLLRQAAADPLTPGA